MDFDLKGYLENEPLAQSKPLIPLFEAVANAVHAVEDHGRRSGNIAITVIRDQAQIQLSAEDMQSRAPIVGFEVRDDGIGFTKPNFESFNTSFSRYKKTRGGRGIGRFSWLQAFDVTTIESTYIENDVWYHRTFSFSAAKGGVHDHRVGPTEASTQSTVVRLSEFKKKYAESAMCPSKTVTLAYKIVEHCLITFLSSNPPRLTLHDPAECTDICLNDFYHEHITPFAKDSETAIKEHSFRVRHMRLYGGDPTHSHRIHLCANEREVMQISLAKRIPSLSRKLQDADGRYFYYSCYVSSPYLDKRANSQRTGFSLHRDGELPFDGEISESDLIGALLIVVKNELGDDLDKLYDEITGKAEVLVNTKYPEYKPLLKQMDSFVDEFPPDVTEEQLLRKFNEIHFEQDIETRKESDAILASSASGEHGVAYRKQLQHYLERVDDAAAVNLSKYVIHRRALLDLLKLRIQAQPNDKYEREEAVHDILFPLRTTSEDVPYHRWNLWIVDERLAFHLFLSSDKPLSTVTGDRSHAREPDLFLLDNPAAFTEIEGAPLNAVTIVEIKRAQRDSYADEGVDKNPVDQVTNYIRQIREGRALSVKGRTITVHSATPFYCYIVADLTPRFREIIEGRGFIKAPDNIGYFWFNQNLGAYFEVISFDKLLNNAEMRNAALFRQLGLL